jgi:SEC-C motif-containing protein
VSCPCGNAADLAACCGPYLDGTSPAPTAEALMRSRYSAYVAGNVDYIIETHNPDSRDEVDRDGAEQWSRGADWLGLEIVATEAGGESDDTGVVEFIARYAAQGKPVAHHERSRFKKIDGAWFYIDGDILRAEPKRRDQPKVGRNEPCPCGSGAKYKKCHGA